MGKITMAICIPIGGKKKCPQESLVLQRREKVRDELHSDTALKLFRNVRQITLPLLKRIEMLLHMLLLSPILREQIYMSVGRHVLIRKQETVIVKQRNAGMKLRIFTPPE
jgi:hypothetical protein